MCRPTTCHICRKTTWAGCGHHIAQVKATVPSEEWCAGHPVGEAGRSLWSRLTGR